MMAERNKLWRNNHTNNRWRKRLMALGLLNAPEKYYCYKEQGKPCSCYMCSGHRKYNRSEFKSETMSEIEIGSEIIKQE